MIVGGPDDDAEMARQVLPDLQPVPGYRDVALGDAKHDQLIAIVDHDGVPCPSPKHISSGGTNAGPAKSLHVNDLRRLQDAQ